MKHQLSELLCGETIKERIDDSLKAGKEEGNCALFLINIDHFSEVYDQLGEEIEDAVLGKAGTQLSLLFDEDTLTGRIGGDQFLVFTAGPIEENEVLEKAKGICKTLRFTAGKERRANVTVSTGAYFASGGQIDFLTLYEKARAALHEAEKRGENSWFVAKDERPRSHQEKRDGALIDQVPLRALLAYMREGAALLEIGDKIRVLCASRGFFRTLGLDRDDLALPCELKEIGIAADEEEAYEKALRVKVRNAGITVHTHRVFAKEGGQIWRHARAVQIARPESRYPIVLEMSMNISEFIKSELQLRESHERLKIAFGQTPHILWEVDLDQKTFRVFSMNTRLPETSDSLGDFPESFFAKGMIHPTSFSTFRRFGNELLAGKTEGNGNFLMRSPKSDRYEWVSLSYRMIFDREGVPIKAVGIEEKMPDISGIQSMRFPRGSLPEVLQHNLIARLRVNLTADTIDEYWADGLDRTAQAGERHYMELVKEWSSELYLSTERGNFERLFNRENLLSAYEEGNRWICGEYRRVEPGGSIRWVMNAANFVCSPYTGDVCLFFSRIDVQQRHEWEKTLCAQAEWDRETGLYTAQTMKALSEQLIKRGTGSNCTTVLIAVQENEEPAGGAAQRRSFASAMSFALGTDCVAGRYKENTAVVFFPDTISRFDIKKRLEDAFTYVRMVMSGTSEAGEIRFIAGAVTEKRQNANYERMLLRASYLCELRKNSASDTIAFPDSDEEWLYIGLRKESESITSVLPWETERPLSREEQKAAFDCVAGMFLHGESVKESLESALREVGMHYRADRVYILKLSQDGQTTSMYSEWVGRDKHSIRHIMSDVQVKRIPLLQRCMKEKAPVFVRRKGDGVPDRQESWNFMIFPMNPGAAREQFLCIENGKQYAEETALLERIVPYLLEEEKREEKKLADAEGKYEKRLNEMPNLHSYLQTIASIDSDMYSTMGVLALDVPNFSAINARHGFAVGKKMLSDIAKALADVFGDAFKFRTWDAEFVALYPDSIQEAFIGRCNRVRTILQRGYPGQIRIGDIWAEERFSGEKLVKEAQEIMRAEAAEPVSEERQTFTGEPGGLSEKTMKKRSFTAYFQPKIDIRDGSVVGAEALAREIDEDGKIHSPACFVEKLEKNKKIRELDFYMLEQVLWQMSEWQSRGYPPVKVSINISRVTLLAPNTLASILAIQSRYPEIMPGQISLEITETAGDIEKTTLSSIVEKFRDFGISFDLDDFGSQYSNMAIFSNVKFDTIKLDKSLIHELPDNEINWVFVKELVTICRDFGMTCVAEGVENHSQADALLQAGCIYGQGYYYARPMPPEKFEKQYLMPLHEDMK